MSRIAATIVTTCFLLAIVSASTFSQTKTPPEAAVAQVDEQPDINALARRLAGEAMHLREDTAARLSDLSRLEAELQKGPSSTLSAQQTVDALISLLNEASARLAPEGTYRKTLDAEEGIVRNLAREAATSTDLEVRNFAENFRKAATDIRNMAVEAEELRTRLVAQIDRLNRLRERLKFTVAAAEVEKFVKNAREYLDNVKAIVDGTQNLANDLENFGHGVPTQ